MEKVPVGRSIAHAYTFLFGRFFQIIGTAWLPALLYGLGCYVFLMNMQIWMPAHPADATALARTLAVALGAGLVVLMIRSVIAISLTQEALGIRKDLTLAHFVIGPRELRLFFGYVRLFIAYIAIYAVILAIIFAANFAAQKFGSAIPANLAVNGVPAARIAIGVLAAVLIIWMLLLVLRVAFILAPVASVEHKTRLMHARQITNGSGWRILIICVAVILPLAIAAYAVFYFMYPNDVANLMQTLSRTKPGTMPDLGPFYAAHAGVLSIMAAVATVLSAALMAGASATAYRGVTGHEDPELEDDAALVAPLLVPVAGHDDHGHEDHGHGGHDSHGNGGDHANGGSDDHGSGGQGDHGHGGDDHGHGNGDDHGNGNDDGGHGRGDHDPKAHGDDGHSDGHDNGHGHDDHGHGSHDDHGHGHGDHGHGDKAHADHANGHDDHGHGNGHGHDDHGHGDNHGHDDHGHGHGKHGDGHHHHAHGGSAKHAA